MAFAEPTAMPLALSRLLEKETILALSATKRSEIEKRRSSHHPRLPTRFSLPLVALVSPSVASLVFPSFGLRVSRSSKVLDST